MENADKDSETLIITPTGKKLTVGYQNRSRNDTLYLKELCDKGELGEIYYAKTIALRHRAVPTWTVFLDEEKQGWGAA